MIICDNGSADRTFQICQAYAARDPRIRAYRNERNLGAAANFKRVFELSSRNEFFRWAASDDLCLPKYLESCIGLLDMFPDAVLAHSATAFIDENGKTFPIDASTCHYRDPMTGVSQQADSPLVGDRSAAVLRFWQVLSQARWGTHMFGVMRRPALERTSLLRNFPSSDRVLLAELALLGRFKSATERLFLKRFHEQVSWALSMADLRHYVDPNIRGSNHRLPQLAAYLAAPWGKPIGYLSQLTCTAMVTAHCARTGVQALAGKYTKEASEAAAWRRIKT